MSRAKQVEIKIRIASRDPSTPVPVVFGRIVNELPKLRATLASRSVSEVSAKRKKGIGLDPSLLFFTVCVFVGTKATETIVEKVVSDVYDWVKSKAKAELMGSSSKTVEVSSRTIKRKPSDKARRVVGKMEKH
jgi:hypothetical protein